MEKLVLTKQGRWLITDAAWHSEGGFPTWDEQATVKEDTGINQVWRSNHGGSFSHSKKQFDLDGRANSEAKFLEAVNVN